MIRQDLTNGKLMNENEAEKKKSGRMRIGNVKLLMMVAMFLLASMSLSYAYCPPPQSGDTCKFGYKPYSTATGTCCYQDIFLNMATVMILVTIGMVAVAYMLGRAMENPKILHWAETELVQVLGTLMILFFYGLSVFILNNWIGPAFYNGSVLFPGESNRAAGGSWTSVQDHVINYLEGSGGIRGTLEKFVYGFSWMSVFMSALSSLSFSLQPDPSLSLFFTPLAATFGPLQSIMGLVFNAVVISAAQLQIQIELIKLGTGLFTILLPLGVLFRAFPFTRPAGGAMIAIAFGFTVMLPIAYLVAEDISLHMYSISGVGGRPSGDAIVAQMASVSFTVGSVDDFQNVITTGFAPGGILRSMAMFLAFELTLLPMMAYLMVLNVTKSLAELMGTHIDFSTIVRLI